MFARFGGRSAAHGDSDDDVVADRLPSAARVKAWHNNQFGIPKEYLRNVYRPLILHTGHGYGGAGGETNSTGSYIATAMPAPTILHTKCTLLNTMSSTFVDLHDPGRQIKIQIPVHMSIDPKADADHHVEAIKGASLNAACGIIFADKFRDAERLNADYCESVNIDKLRNDLLIGSKQLCVYVNQAKATNIHSTHPQGILGVSIRFRNKRRDINLCTNQSAILTSATHIVPADAAESMSSEACALHDFTVMARGKTDDTTFITPSPHHMTSNFMRSAATASSLYNIVLDTKSHQWVDGEQCFKVESDETVMAFFRQFVSENPSHFDGKSFPDDKYYIGAKAGNFAWYLPKVAVDQFEVAGEQLYQSSNLLYPGPMSVVIQPNEGSFSALFGEPVHDADKDSTDDHEGEGDHFFELAFMLELTLTFVSMDNAPLCSYAEKDAALEDGTEAAGSGDAEGGAASGAGVAGGGGRGPSTGSSGHRGSSRHGGRHGSGSRHRSKRGDGRASHGKRGDRMGGGGASVATAHSTQSKWTDDPDSSASSN